MSYLGSIATAYQERKLELRREDAAPRTRTPIAEGTFWRKSDGLYIYKGGIWRPATSRDVRTSKQPGAVFYDPAKEARARRTAVCTSGTIRRDSRTGEQMICVDGVWVPAGKIGEKIDRETAVTEIRTAAQEEAAIMAQQQQAAAQAQRVASRNRLLLLGAVAAGGVGLVIVLRRRRKAS